MRILVVNDDGIQDRGLWALAEALEPLGEVRVYAPDRNYSGAGMSVALTPEFHLQRAGPPDGIAHRCSRIHGGCFARQPGGSGMRHCL